MDQDNVVKEEQVKKKKPSGLKKWQIDLIIVAACCIVLIGAWFIYVSIYYEADEDALKYLQGDEHVMVMEIRNGWFFDGPGEEEAFIFYPGAKVESKAYAPLLFKLAQDGLDCFLIDMPSRMAFLGTHRADDVLKEYSYDKWYMGGHSLGGAIASYYVSDHLDRFTGMVLLASFPVSNLKREGFRVLSVYGSEDNVLNHRIYEKGKKYFPDNYSEYRIEGGNHAQIGSYGKQRRDGEARISKEEQWSQTEEIILDFLNNK